MTEGDAARRGKDALSLSGGHLCHACGHQYPNPNPSAKLRRSHRRNCPKQPTPEATAGERNAAVGPPLVPGTYGTGPWPVPVLVRCFAFDFVCFASFSWVLTGVRSARARCRWWW
jgi:hypothetical protein